MQTICWHAADCDYERRGYHLCRTIHFIYLLWIRDSVAFLAYLIITVIICFGCLFAAFVLVERYGEDVLIWLHLIRPELQDKKKETTTSNMIPTPAELLSLASTVHGISSDDD